jgi:hypothetical protein
VDPLSFFWSWSVTVFEICCFNCGHALYSSREFVATKDVLKDVEFKCPQCKIGLGLERFTVEIVTPEGSVTRTASPPQRLEPPSGSVSGPAKNESRRLVLVTQA